MRLCTSGRRSTRDGKFKEPGLMTRFGHNRPIKRAKKLASDRLLRTGTCRMPDGNKSAEAVSGSDWNGE